MRSSGHCRRPARRPDLHNRLYDRLTRDPALGELRDGNTRLFLMRADAFMDAFARLDEDARYTMFAAFARSIAEHSGQSAQSARHYRHELGPAAREIFLNAAVNLAADMGWGAWKFGPPTPGEITLEVTNSPFAEGYGTSTRPVCAPVVGLMEALGGIVFAYDPVCAETGCAAVTGEGVCRFTARLD